MKTVREIIDPSILEEIGKFRRTHALRGELNAEFYDELSVEQLMQLVFLIVEIDGIPTPFRIESIRPKGAVTMLVKLAGVDDADNAATFINKPIYADESALDACCSDEDRVEDDEEGVYAQELTGYKAVDSQGNNIGVVENVDTSTANPLLEIESVGGQKILIPVNGPFIQYIDLNTKVVIIDAPDELLGLNKKKV